MMKLPLIIFKTMGTVAPDSEINGCSGSHKRLSG